MMHAEYLTCDFLDKWGGDLSPEITPRHRCPPFSFFFSATRTSPCPLSYSSSRSRYFHLIHLLRDIKNLRLILTLELAFAQWMAAKIQRLRKFSVYTWEHKPVASGLFSLEACSPIAYHIG
ncbi:hypothetical protein ALC56_12873 [Trachymyrmex septentrionalis]|uniref:Uncharacterized protein n=1 Tax=Trachymyrmex septentrionalis TaxID=34720 RepID=A0A195EX55_9HYME|nr:hypothetical protein ALC56_12873 [Trachymyrmex septentrionalis]